MKVLFVEGARKGGSTDKISCRLEEGLLKNGHETERVYLFGKQMNGCLGCNHCRNTDGTCVFKDDLPEVIDKFMEADLIVLVSPVYFYSVTAQLKTFIDRTFAVEHRVKRKKMIFITSSMAPYTERQIPFLKTVENTYLGYVACFHGEVENLGILGGWGTGTAYSRIEDHPVYDEAYELGLSIH